MKLKSKIATLAFVLVSLHSAAQKDVPTTYTDAAIPANVMGINTWAPDHYVTTFSSTPNGPVLNANIQTMVENDGSQVYRIGGDGYDKYGVAWNGTTTTTNDYIRVIEAIKVRNPNAKYLIQTPYKAVNAYTFTAAMTGSLAANLVLKYPSYQFYYSVGNEWNRYPGVTMAQISNDFKSYGQAIKENDPNAIVIGPSFDSFYAAASNSNCIQTLYTYSNSLAITGTITSGPANGKPYVDIIDFHEYPGGINGSMINPTTSTSAVPSTTVAAWRATMDAHPQGKFADELCDCTTSTLTGVPGIQKLINNAGRGSGSTHPLKIALTEMNITTCNPTLTSQSSTNPGENTFQGIATRSFFAGQWWMEMFCSFMVNSGGMSEFMAPWSIYEAAGTGTLGDLGMTRGTASLNIDPIPLPTYHHYEMLADNIRNCTYIRKAYSNTAIKAFGAYNTINTGANAKYVMMLINQSTVDIATGLELDSWIAPGNIVTMSFPGSITYPGVYSYTVNANSTHVLVFNDEGDILRKVVYKQSDGVNGVPVYTN